MSLDESCQALAELLADYRHDDLAAPTQAHVKRWVEQFDNTDQEVIASETLHVLRQTYVSKTNYKRFLSALAQSQNILGDDDPTTFWNKSTLLNIQERSQSQASLVETFHSLLKENFDIEVTENEHDKPVWFYIDDGIFSGRQVYTDLQRWVRESEPRSGTLHIVVMCAHQFGVYDIKRQLRRAFGERSIAFKIWRIMTLENRLTYRNVSDVLWPQFTPGSPSIQEWLDANPNALSNFKCRIGSSLGKQSLFSSHDARLILERAFFEKGAFICQIPTQANQMMRPLGNTSFRMPGFGTMFATYRNCPNNAPLVLWWGEPGGNATLRQWYPLMQRRVRGA